MRNTPRFLIFSHLEEKKYLNPKLMRVSLNRIVSSFMIRSQYLCDVSTFLFAAALTNYSQIMSFFF